LWAARSGATDPEDKSDVWKFCQGKVALFYVWMGCFHIGEDTDDFLNMFIRTLGEDSNAEDGWDGSPIIIDGNNDKEELDKTAHPKRPRLLHGLRRMPRTECLRQCLLPGGTKK